jgi:hypothetical protein
VVDKIKVIEGEENPAVAEWIPVAKPTPRYKSVIELLEKERNLSIRSSISDLRRKRRWIPAFAGVT